MVTSNSWYIKFHETRQTKRKNGDENETKKRGRLEGVASTSVTEWSTGILIHSIAYRRGIPRLFDKKRWKKLVDVSLPTGHVAPCRRTIPTSCANYVRAPHFHTTANPVSIGVVSMDRTTIETASRAATRGSNREFARIERLWIGRGGTWFIASLAWGVLVAFDASSFTNCASLCDWRGTSSAVRSIIRLEMRIIRWLRLQILIRQIFVFTSTCDKRLLASIHVDRVFIFYNT